MEYGVFKDTESYLESVLCEKYGVFNGVANTKEARRQAQYKFRKQLNELGIFGFEIRKGVRQYSGKILNLKLAGYEFEGDFEEGSEVA